MAGEALFEVMGGSGKVIEIQGDMAVSTGTERSEGFGQALEAAPASPSLSRHPPTSTTDWPPKPRKQALEKDPDFAGVFATNLDMLSGAPQAVRQRT